MTLQPTFVQFLGPLDNDAHAVAAGPDGKLYVCGRRTDAPQTWPPSAFVAVIDVGGGLIFEQAIGYPAAGDGTVAHGIAVGEDGSCYVTGWTSDPNIPADEPGTEGYRDVFIAKFDAYGDPVYLRRFGGGPNSQSGGLGIAVDRSGLPYVTGFAQGAMFPVTPRSIVPGPAPLTGETAFMVSLDADGAIRISSLLSVGVKSCGYSIALLESEARHPEPVVTGRTSGGFPTADMIGRPGQVTDCFVAHLGARGDRLLWSSVVGDLGVTVGRDVAVGRDSSIWVTGHSWCEELPTTDKSSQAFSFINGVPGNNVMVIHFGVDRQLELLSTIPGDADDSGLGISASGKGEEAWVTGSTSSHNFPTTTNAIRHRQLGLYNDSYDAFLMRIDNMGMQNLPYSTLLGGMYDDLSRAITITPDGGVAVAGNTSTDADWDGVQSGSLFAGPIPLTAFCARFDPA
jgi:hypothetical protein